MIPNTEKVISDKKYCERLFKNYLRKKVLKETRPDFFSKYLNKALSNLTFANFIFEEHMHSIKEKLPGMSFFDKCVESYYYAVYHSALALCSRSGYESKSHLATITAITLFYYHHDNILQKEDIQFLIDSIDLPKEEIEFVFNSKDVREKATYGVDKIFEKKQAEMIQEHAVGFVGKIRSFLGK